MSAIFLSRVWDRPYVFDVEDLQPDAAADLGMLPGWALRALYAVEQVAYKNAALVSTLTRGMRNRITEKGVSADKVVLFEPRADESLFEIADEEGLAFRKKFSLEGKFVVSHSGNIGVKQGLDVILDAAVRNREERALQFLIVGGGADKRRIEARADELGLENVRFLPLLDGMDYRGLLAASDVCLVTQRRTVSDIVFPSKTVTYLAAGCAVIASVNVASEVAQCIGESGAGRVVEPEDGRALSEAIREFMRGDLKERRKAAKKYARNRWSAHRVLGFIERSLAAVCESPPAPMAGREVPR